MNRKRRYRHRKDKLDTVIFILVFILFSFGAVKIGVLGGNLIFNMDNSLVKSIDSQSLKLTLGKSLPLIDTIYNSGNISLSFSGEINSLIKKVFNFDAKRPVTIFNVQSSFFNSYYSTGYKDILAQLEREKESEKLVVDASDLDPEDTNENISENTKIPDTENNTGDSDKDTSDQANAEAESSIVFENEHDDSNKIINNPISSTGKIEIINESKIKLSQTEIDKLLKEPLKINFNRKGPEVLIYHTHTTESYLKDKKEFEKSKKEIPNWTLDLDKSVVSVGNVIKECLEETGVSVIHNGTIHDYPSYPDSYSNSLSTISSYVKSYPSIKVTLDIHRDGLAPDKPRLRLPAKINGKDAAQIMFVIGTDERFKNPKWKENLKFALKLQEKINEENPGLARPILISKNRFNQHMAETGLIIEVGSDGNTLEEVRESAKYIGKVLGEVLKIK